MPTFHFTGRVHPSGVNITIENLPLHRLIDVETGYRTSYQIAIVESYVSVEVVSEFPLVPDHLAVSDMAGRAIDIAKAAVNLFSFNLGWGLSLTIDRFIDDGGIETVLVPRLPGAGPFDSSLNANTVHRVDDGTLDWIYELITHNPTIAQALNDLVAAITLPGSSEVSCGRSVEGIRTALSPDEADRDTAWANMRSALNLNREYLVAITALSRGPRHGKKEHTPFEVISNVTSMAWEVMTRFIALRQRNLLKLPEDEFPLL